MNQNRQNPMGIDRRTMRSTISPTIAQVGNEIIQQQADASGEQQPKKPLITPMQRAELKGKIVATLTKRELIAYIDSEYVVEQYIARKTKQVELSNAEMYAVMRTGKSAQDRLNEDIAKSPFAEGKPCYDLGEINSRLYQLQEEIHEWSSRNFGLQLSKHNGTALGSLAPLLGIGEEIGELASAGLVDDAHSIENVDLAIDAMCDTLIYLCDYASRSNFRLSLDKASIDKAIIEKLFSEIGLDSNKTGLPALMAIYGSLLHINLKRHQGIRGWDNAEQFDTRNTELCRDILVELFTASACSILDWVDVVWGKVKHRDWVKNQANAHKVAEAAEPST